MSNRTLNSRKGEAGTATLEFAFIALIYFTLLLSVFAGGFFYASYNALADSTRRGARYAVMHDNSAAEIDKVKNIVVYGTDSPAVDARPLAPNLQTSNVVVEYSNFGVNQGSVTVSITNYNYNFVIPALSQAIPMPEYRTTMRGESAGYAP